MRDQPQVDKDQITATARITEPDSPEQVLAKCIPRAQSREDLWVEFINSVAAPRMAEIGVYRGDFAAFVLQRRPSLTTYYMIDPWRHLDDWNKPANHDDSALGAYLEETKAKTDFAAVKRIILRGRTAEVIDQITDGELDLAYIDGDHTLKGITVDLIRVYPRCESAVSCAEMTSRAPYGSTKRVSSPRWCFPSLCILLRASALRSSRCLTRSSAFTKRRASNSRSSI
jgi:Methyltransferase domain